MTQQIADELDRLWSDDGMLYADDVVRFARRHPGSALHQQFEWDDALAAEQHRLAQARRLIAIHLVSAPRQRRTISLVVDRPVGGGYRDLGAVLSHAEMRRLALSQALAEVQRWAQRHDHLRELEPVFAAIERAATGLLTITGEAAD